MSHVVQVGASHASAPLHWREQRGATLFLNPGRNSEGPFPNHILVRTDEMSCRLITAPRANTHETDFPLKGTLRAENPATTAVA